MQKSRHVGSRLQEMVDRFSPHLLEVRGRGMMLGLCCADPKRAAAVTSTAFKHGLIFERSDPKDQVIKCLIPLTIPRAQMDEGLDILEHALLDEFGDRVVGMLEPRFPEKAATAAGGVRSL